MGVGEVMGVGEMMRVGVGWESRDVMRGNGEIES
jgi:hypothetical protein